MYSRVRFAATRCGSPRFGRTFRMASAAQADTSADTKSGMSEENGEIENKRPMFGNRLLVDPNQVFSHNAWDNIAWSDEQIERAQAKVMEISSEVLDSDSQRCYEDEADKFWDKFYGVHQNRFFKDRNWLFTEFPELEVHSALVGQQELMESSYEGCVSRRQILEVGCGVGNTVFPLLSTLPDDDLFVYCCDFSPVAVNLVKENPAYDTKRCHAFVCDVSDPDAEVPFPEGSIDIITLVFTMSAIHPDKHRGTLKRLASYLKPGGLILFRDYGLYDMAQLRFKKGRCLAQNFYVRGDGTRVYFFTQEEVHKLMESAGLKKLQNLMDKRLQVNRGKQVTMYRVWIQAKYQKPR